MTDLEETRSQLHRLYSWLKRFSLNQAVGSASTFRAACDKLGGHRAGTQAAGQVSGPLRTGCAAPNHRRASFSSGTVERGQWDYVTRSSVRRPASDEYQVRSRRGRSQGERAASDARGLNEPPASSRQSLSHQRRMVSPTVG
jgi:hypothetical protein